MNQPLIPRALPARGTSAIVTVLILCGTALSQLTVIVASLLGGLPTAWSGRSAAFVLLGGGVAAVLSGIVGSHAAIRSGRLRHGGIKTFAWLYTLQITLPGYADWRSLTLGIRVDFDELIVGVNLLGVGMLAAYTELAGQELRQERSPLPAQTTPR
jgi:hypothetical protein